MKKLHKKASNALFWLADVVNTVNSFVSDMTCKMVELVDILVIDKLLVLAEKLDKKSRKRKK